MFTVHIDDRQAKRDLRKFREHAIPHAMRNALNTAAFETRRIWQNEVRSTFTLRNHFTERSILVEKARGTVPATMVAVVGSTAPYMGDQEHGAMVRGRSGKKAIPGPAAAGQPPGSKRTRLVRAGARLGAIHLRRPSGGRSARQRNAIALSMARRSGTKDVLLERPKGGKGIFRVSGGRRRLQLRLLWDVSRGAVRVPRAPTLERSLARLQPKLGPILHAATLEQLRRARVFGY